MKYALQLYSVREYAEKDLIGALRQAAQLGYEGVEFAGYFGTPASELRDALRETGLTAVGSHVPLKNLYADLGAEIDYARACGIETIAIPFIPPEERAPETFSRLIGVIPEFTRACESAGLRFAYHNHDFEFVKQGDGFLLDAILGACGTLKMELDSYWCFHAGVDPVGYLEQHRAQATLLHVKDYLKRTENGVQFCALGSGKLDSTPYLKKAASLGVEWAIVEQDNSLIDVWESARRSIETLRVWGQ